MEKQQVPEAVISRLPLYLRVLEQLRNDGFEVVNSGQLATLLHSSPGQIRKDLTYFGHFGKRGEGYRIAELADNVRQIIGLDRVWNAAVIGVGSLGSAVINYPGFEPAKFRIVAAFDREPEIIGTVVNGIHVQDISELPETVVRSSISIGIVTVPGEYAQNVAGLLIKAGIEAILNYAPIQLRTPEHVKVANIDPVLSLQSMTYHLKNTRSDRKIPSL